MLVPSIGIVHAEWRGFEDCLWLGHPSLRTKRPLGIHEEFSSRPHVVHLFRNLLCLEDAKLATYLEEIEFYKVKCQLADPEDTDPEYTDPEDRSPGDLVLADDYHEGLNYEYLESGENEENKIYVSLSALIEMYDEVNRRADEGDDACHIR